MKTIIEWSEEQKQAWDEWVTSRPEMIQEMCRKWPPNVLYRLDPPGQNVYVVSYNENGTVMVNVTQEFNPDLVLVFNRTVFGVNPDDLKEIP